MSKSKEIPIKFEDAIEQVEAMIDRIESGQIGLEECIEQYEQGMKLLGRCQTILSSAQKRIEELTADKHGKLRVASGSSGGGGDEEPAVGSAHASQTGDSVFTAAEDDEENNPFQDSQDRSE